MNRDEEVRQQRDGIDWDGLETEIEVNTKAKVDRLVETLPARLKVSRNRGEDSRFASEKAR